MRGPVRPLIIVNLRARRVARDPSIVRELVRLGAPVAATSTVDELDARLATEAPTRVVLVGGDGTHMVGLSRLAARGALPEVALVAAGTVSTAARALGSRGNVTDEAAAALAATRVEPHATISVELDDGRRLVGFTFGAGLVSRYFEEYDATSRGLAAAASVALKVALGAPLGAATARRVLARTPASLRANGAALDAAAYSLVVASALRDVGLGVKVTYRAGERLDRVHVVASTASPAGLALASPRTLLGRSLGSAAELDALVETLEVDFPAPTRVVVDGDTFEVRRAVVRAGPPLPRVVARP